MKKVELITKNKVKERLAGLYKLREEVNDLWLKSKQEEIPMVTKNDVAEAIARMTGIPVTEISEEEKDKLLDLENKLREHVVGQDHAITTIANATRRSRAGVVEGGRPIGSFLFLGPSGVGKTFLAECLAEVLYGDRDSIIRIDMSEFMERHNVSRLVGAPPGYVGYDEGGQLTENVRRRPYSVVLFDEIEKAHPDAYNLLLQILDKGTLTDGQGREVDFQSTIIILTSNIGSELLGETAIGFSHNPRDQISDHDKERIMTMVKAQFRPEFINRLDEIIVFGRLGQNEIEKIIISEINKLKNRLLVQGIKLKVGNKVIAHFAKKGYDPQYGARPIKRLLQKELENTISENVIRFSGSENNIIEVNLLKNEIVIKGKEHGKKNRQKRRIKSK